MERRREKTWKYRSSAISIDSNLTICIIFVNICIKYDEIFCGATIFFPHFDSISIENNVEHWILSRIETCASFLIVVSLKLVQTNNMPLRLDLLKSTPKIIYADAFTRFTFVIPIYWWESFSYLCRTGKKDGNLIHHWISHLVLNRLMEEEKKDSRKRAVLKRT